jgi:hypothetical protein
MMKLKALLLIIGCLFFGGGNLIIAASPDDDYDPVNPDEPSAIDYCRVTVSTNYEEGAYVSGGGKYLVNGGSIYISTNANRLDLINTSSCHFASKNFSPLVRKWQTQHGTRRDRSIKMHY